MDMQRLQEILANERSDETGWLDEPGRVEAGEAARAWWLAGSLDRGPAWFSAGPRILLSHAWPMILKARDQRIREAEEEIAVRAEEAGDKRGEESGENQPRPVKILHVGARGGDLTLQLANRCRKQKTAVEIEAIDWNRDAIALLQNAAEDYPEIQARTRDVFEMEGDEHARAFDVVIATNAIHRLPVRQRASFVNLLARMARVGIVVQGLARSPGAWMATALLVGGPVGATLRRDAPAAVRRAAAFEEWADLAERTGLPGITLTPHFPFRAALVWKRDDFPEKRINPGQG